MSRKAVQYVLGLGSAQRVTKRLKFFLLRLSIHEQENRPTFWPSHRSLAEDLLCDDREIRRLTDECEKLGIIRFRRGRGTGQNGEYTFLELSSTQGKSTLSLAGDTQGGTQGKSTRRNKELQTQILKNPLTPLQGGRKALTTRQLEKLRRRVEFWLQDCHAGPHGILSLDHPDRHDGLPLFDAIVKACGELLIPIDAAIQAFRDAGIMVDTANPEQKKQPAKAAG